MRIIDADALKEYIDKYLSVLRRYEPRDIKMYINRQPTIEAEPVRHGKWIWDEEGYHCSECWYHAQGNIMECIDGTFRFCPVCGAKMDEAKE